MGIHQQSDQHHIGLKSLLLLLVCVFISFVIVCDQKNSNESDEPDRPPFMIENLGIRFAPWDQTTNRAGDFLFLDISNVTKVVSEFGTEVVAWDGTNKLLPTIDFIVRDDAAVFAVAEGVVSRLFFQEGDEWSLDDWEIGVQSVNDPNYEVGYDHLVNVQVEMGDTLSAGDIIGYPRPLFEGLGAFEIMINNYETGLSYCIFSVFNPESIEEYLGKITRLMEDWETFKNDTTIYDEFSSPYPGCLIESMVTY